MNLEELRQFSDTVATPRLMELFEKTVIPDGTCFIDSLEISFFDGRSFGVESQIKASGLLYREGTVESYSYDECDIDIDDFMAEHKDCFFVSDGLLRIMDEIAELEVSSKIRNIGKCSEFFFQLSAPKELKIESSSIMYEKMKYLLHEGNANSKAPLSEQIDTAAQRGAAAQLQGEGFLKVKHFGWGIVKDEQGNEYMVPDEDSIDDITGLLESQTTGELFKITKRDENGDPIEIQNLYEYEQTHKADNHERF